MDVPGSPVAAVLVDRRDPVLVSDFPDCDADRLGHVIADREANPRVTGPVQQPVAGARADDPEQQLNRFDVLGGDLLQRLFGHLDLVGGSVRSSVARSQLAGQRLAGLIAIGEHRMKAEATLEVPGRTLLLRMRADQRRVQVDRQPPRGASKPPYLGTGVRGAQPLQPCRVAGDLVDHPKRRRARRHLAEQHGLITDRTEVGKAITAIGQHHRQIPDHATTIMAAGPPLQPAELRRQRPRQADLVSNSGKQRAARMRHQTLSVRRDIYVDPASIVRHLQGDPPRVDPSCFNNPKKPRSGGQPSSQAAPDPGAATVSCTIRANETASRDHRNQHRITRVSCWCAGNLAGLPGDVRRQIL